MQQTLNSYNLYSIPSTQSATAAGTAQQVILGSGTYDIDGSVVFIKFTNRGTNNVANMRLQQRCDCAIPMQAPTIVTIDGTQRGQYINLTAAQLAWFQDQGCQKGIFDDVS